DHAARERIESALLPPSREVVSHLRGARPDLTQDRPEDQGKTHDSSEDDDGTKDARLDFVVLPCDEERARPVRKPREARGERQHTQKKQYDTRHGCPVL